MKRLVPGLVAGVAFTSIATGSAGWATPCSPVWRRFVVPSVDRAEVLTLSSVASDNVWAVGTTNLGKHTLILHWNGVRWARTPAPDPGSGDNEISDVAAVSKTDAWAVGTHAASDFVHYSGLLLHWNGHSWHRARVVPANDGLDGVSAISATDVWMLGDDQGFPAVFSWNEMRWLRRPDPLPVRNGRQQVAPDLTGILALAPNDVWVGGGTLLYSGVNLPVLEHWNGVHWRLVPTPQIDVHGGLGELSATSPTDIWAGAGNNGGTGLMHWNGRRWTSYGAAGDTRGISMLASNDGWLVTPLRHWNGSRWRLVTIPGFNFAGDAVIDGVTTISAKDVWIGGWPNSGRDHPLFFHYACR